MDLWITQETYTLYITFGSMDLWITQDTYTLYITFGLMDLWITQETYTPLYYLWFNGLMDNPRYIYTFILPLV